MNKATEYRQIFTILRSAGFKPDPIIKADLDENGDSINPDISLFIGGFGLKNIKEYILDEIEEIKPFENDISEYVINGWAETQAEINSSPVRIEFYEYGLVMPLQDFLDITQEWIDYLNSLPFEHSLSEK